MSTHYCNESLLPGECIACIGDDPRSIRYETWGGRVRVPCEVLKRTPKRYKVRILATSATPRLDRGQVLHVPLSAVLDSDGLPMAEKAGR